MLLSNYTMLIKKFKNNLLIGWIFLICVLSITTIPVLERIIFKEKSFFNKLYNNTIMGPINHYGYGLVPKYVINFDFDWEKTIEVKKKLFFSQLKTFLKDDYDLSSMDFEYEDNNLHIHSNKNIIKLLKNYKNIYVKEIKKNNYLIILKPSIINQWKKEIFNNVIKFLQMTYINKSSYVKIINDHQLELHLFSETNINKIELKNYEVKGYGLVEFNRQIPDNKKIMIGGSSPFPVYKYPVFDRTMIKSFEWLDHEKFYLLKLNLTKEALQNINGINKFSMNKIIIAINNTQLNQEDFGNGFKPMNSDDKLLMGLLMIQKGGGVNNFVVQTLFNEESKIILTKYFNKFSYDGVLKQKNIIFYPSNYSNNFLKIILLILILLILFFIILFIILFKKLGLISSLDMSLNTLLLIFFIRLFDLVIDIRIIFLMILFIIINGLINFWRNWLINKQKISMSNDGNFMYRTQLFNQIDKIFNWYNLISSGINWLLYFYLKDFHHGFMMLLMMNGVIFLSHNFFWKQWCLYYTVLDLQKNTK